MRFILFTVLLLLVPVSSIADGLISVSLPENTEELISVPMAPRVTLPVIETTKFKDGVVDSGRVPRDGSHKCLPTPSWKTIILMASAYKGLYNWRLQITGIVSGLLFIIQQNDTLIANYTLQLNVYKQDRKYLQLRLKQNNKIAGKLSRSHNIEKYALWCIVVAQAIGIVVLGIKSGAN